jgi:hypothetical protein
MRVDQQVSQAVLAVDMEIMVELEFIYMELGPEEDLAVVLDHQEILLKILADMHRLGALDYHLA